MTGPTPPSLSVVGRRVLARDDRRDRELRAVAAFEEVPLPPEPPDDGPDFVEPPGPGGSPSARVVEYEVEHELRRLRVRDEAARRLRAGKAATELPRPVLLSEFLAQPAPPSRWRLEGLMPAGARVVLAAAWKAGKTTMMGNLVRSLADGDPFLGAHDLVPNGRRVVLIDDELDEDMLREWLRAQRVRHPDAVAVLSLRGRVSTFDLLDADTRARWAERLGDMDPGVVLFDCLRPALDALGLDESREVGRFLEPFDEMLHAANADEAVVVHHMGHTGERSRGDSRLRDWPDVEWRLVREDADDPGSPRYFSAYGRDVEVGEARLDYDPASRRLTITGGSRRDTAGEAVVPALLELLAESPGLSGRRIEERLTAAGEAQKAVRSAVKAAVSDGSVFVTSGPRGAALHHLSDASASVRRSASPARQRGPSECVSASIEDALTHTDADESSASGNALVCDRCSRDTDRLIHGRCRRCAYPTEPPEEE